MCLATLLNSSAVGIWWAVHSCAVSAIWAMHCTGIDRGVSGNIWAVSVLFIKMLRGKLWISLVLTSPRGRSAPQVSNQGRGWAGSYDVFSSIHTVGGPVPFVGLSSSWCHAIYPTQPPVSPIENSSTTSWYSWYHHCSPTWGSNGGKHAEQCKKTNALAPLWGRRTFIWYMDSYPEHGSL